MDRVPSPAFDHDRYERPTRRWLCGGACKNGPSAFGKCGADGPDKCRPIRSLRALRGSFAWWIVAITIGGLALAFAGPWGFRFINPAPVSAQHSRFVAADVRRLTSKLGEPSDSHEIRASSRRLLQSQECSACHRAATKGVTGWVRAAFLASPGPGDFKSLTASSPPNMASIEGACLKCHPGSDFHQPNITRNLHCTVCHPEHVGSGPIKLATTKDCVSCHGDAKAMLTAAERGTGLATELFGYQFLESLRLFEISRPSTGYTKVIQSFSTDHPEFQIRAENARETKNTLRFNHHEHLSKGFRLPNGKQLNCTDCHQLNSDGLLHQRIGFAKHCASCHALEFDPSTRGLELPHGNPALVRAFIHSLRKQYEDYAINVAGTTGKEAVARFVAAQMTNIYRRVGLISGQQGWEGRLENEIFFSDNRHRRFADGTTGRSEFQGCQKCHEVTARSEAPPSVTPPIMPDRWMKLSAFNHAKHVPVPYSSPAASTYCIACHADAKHPEHSALHSRETSDVLLPSKAACVSCHSATGSVSESCMTCHKYHRERKSMHVTAAGSTSDLLRLLRP